MQGSIDLQIENRKYDSGMTYVDTILEFCEINQVDYIDVVKELHSSTIDKVKVEFINRNMVKGEKINNSIDFFDIFDK